MNYESPLIQSLGQEDIDTQNLTDAGWFWQAVFVAAYAVVAGAVALIVVEVA